MASQAYEEVFSVLARGQVLVFTSGEADAKIVTVRVRLPAGT